MYRQPSKVEPRTIPAIELPWNRTFGWAIAAASLAAGLMAGLESPDPADAFASEHPWWLGLVLAVPAVAFGLVFTVNRTRWRFVGDQLTVSNHPVPLPRPRRYPVSRVARFEARSAEDADRIDLVAILEEPRQVVALYKGLANDARAESLVESLEAALREARESR